MELMEFEEYELLHEGIYKLSGTLTGFVALVKGYKALPDDLKTEIRLITAHARFLNDKMNKIFSDNLEEE